MKDAKRLEGGYLYRDNKFIPTGDIVSINKKLEIMKLIVGSTEGGYPCFYYHPIYKNYWSYIQYENYHTILEPIERSEIERLYPYLDCDNLIDVNS